MTCQNVDLGIAALAEQREIRCAPADVDNQPQVSGPQSAAICQRRRFRLVHKIHTIKPRPAIGFAQIFQRLGIARIVGRVKPHRPPRKGRVKPLPRSRLGAGLYRGQKPSNDLDEIQSFAQKYPLFAYQPGTEQAF